MRGDAGPSVSTPSARRSRTLSPDDLARFRKLGFVVLARAFDPGALSAEIDRALGQPFRAPFRAAVGEGAVTGRYVPMQSARTPASTALIAALEPTAALLLGGRVLPVRAKGVLYFGETPWHRDSEHDVPSVGLAAYLEPLRAASGALRVRPGTHRTSARDVAAEPEAEIVVETEPGDVIAFDEHLLHASFGGDNRRQWRVDFVGDPVGAEQEARVRAYFGAIFRPDWDGGYDVDAYPSYGPDWMASGRPWVARLAQLGVYDAAAAEEAFARSRS